MTKSEIVIRPQVLDPNVPRRFYRGGRRLCEWRSFITPDDWRPEDWIASCVSTNDDSTQGLSKLKSGQSLITAISESPVDWLGHKHVAHFGTNPAMLVKLLDPGTRIPVHCHPDDQFAIRHFASRFGKTEAWHVLEATSNATVMVGFREAVTLEELRALEATRGRDMFERLNVLPVSPGDTIFIPAGVPHSIPPGVLLLEIQQPSDVSVMLETPETSVPREHPAITSWLQCVDRSSWPIDRVRPLLRGPSDSRLLPPEADQFFRLDTLTPNQWIDSGFSVLIVQSGNGQLVAQIDRDAIDLREGQAVVVPYSAGPQLVVGHINLLRCRPPAV